MVFVPFDSLLRAPRPRAVPAPKPAPAAGCTASACGSAAGPADLPPEVWAKIADHPCYSEEAHHYFARMHVAVAPACNIQCHYCNRKYDCANESRPGVVSERLTPEQALRKVVAVANDVPQLAVLGIAGPGDALYDWRRTKCTFELVARAIPDIKLCVSTNGLALPDHVDELADMNVDHVTITINMVDPEIGAKIYPWVFFRHERHTGVAAARILHERQMLGLEMLAARGILVKVNSVLIPGVNDAHLAAVHAEVTRRGAFLHNMMPLISDPAHGTHYGLTGQRGPTHAELEAVQAACGDTARLMRHCRQCRADAVGLLGEDRGQAFALAALPENPVYDGETRRTYRAVIARERADHAAARRDASAILAKAAPGAALTVAVATRGGGRVNQHFGKAGEFAIYRATADGVVFVGTRKVGETYCGPGGSKAGKLDAVIAALAGVDVVLCAKVGDCPQGRLEAAGLVVRDDFAENYIETAVARALVDVAGAAPRALSA